MRRGIISLLVVLFIIAAGVWFMQARLLRFAANRFSGGAVSVAEVKGNLAAGFYLYGVSVKTAVFKGSAAKVFVRPAIAGSLRNKPTVADLTILFPGAVLRNTGGVRKDVFPVWLPAIRLVAITDGSVAAGGKIFSGIDCRFSYSGGKITVMACSGNSEGLSAVFSGEYSAGRATAQGRIEYAPGKTAVDFEYSMSGKTQVFSGTGAAAGAPLGLKGEINGANWTAELLLKKLIPLSAFHPALPQLKVRSASVSASGSGFSPDTLFFSGKFAIQERAGSAALGTFKFRRGNAAMHATCQTGDISGVLDATVKEGLLSGSLRAAGGAELRLPNEDKLLIQGIKAACFVGGSLKAPSLSCEAEAGEIKSSTFTASAAKFSGFFAAGVPEKFNFNFLLQAPAFGETRVELAVLKAEGTIKNNVFTVDISSQGKGLRLEGTSSFNKGAWEAKLNNLSLSLAPGWQLCSPAKIVVSVSGGAEVAGFCLMSGEASFNLSGKFRTRFPQELHAALKGFQLAELEKAGLTERRAGGLVNASADYSGGAAGTGTFSISAADLELEGMALGTAGARGTFGPDSARLEEAAWKIYGGEVKASGWLTMEEKRAKADFLVKASSMNIAPLLLFFPQVLAQEVWLDGESRVLISGKVLKSSGAINMFAPGLGLPSFGLALNNASITLAAGDISSAQISILADKDGGKIAAQGQLSALGPEVRIRVAAMPFNHPSGFSGKAGTDLRLFGSWEKPELSGTVDLQAAKFSMEKWNKLEPTAGKSRFYEAMSMELEIAAQRNVWYREGASSVEVKGNLLLKKDHYRSLSVLGSIETLQGYYVYMGNTFDINSGRLIFAGEIPLNPAIEISASNEDRSRAVKVYFNAAGTVKTPQIVLSSDPPMEQRDIISLLLTGKPLYELYGPRTGASRQSRAGDAAAQNLAAGYLSQKAFSGVRERYNIDVINLKVNTEQKADITVGRYLTRDLFVSYGQVLGQGGEKRVSAEYSIARHWSLEGKNSSDGRYVADLLFKYGIK